ncbi:MAG: hypothetical protein AAFO82_00935 [Bacteroidota bacterium]
MQEPLDKDLISENEVNQSIDYQTYRSFHSREEAMAFVELLEQHDIPYMLEGSSTVIDKAIVGEGFIPKVFLKILTPDFKKVNSFIEENLKNIDYSDIDDHYLIQLDNAELMEIFEKPDEWSIEDVSIARVILEHRGTVLDEVEIRESRTKRLAEIRKGKKGTPIWMILYGLGIVLGMFVSLIFLIAGIGMGYYYTYGKSVDPDGQKYYVFDESTRNYGAIIFYGGITFLVVTIVLIFIFGISIEISDWFSFWGYYIKESSYTKLSQLLQYLSFIFFILFHFKGSYCSSQCKQNTHHGTNDSPITIDRG